MGDASNTRRAGDPPPIERDERANQQIPTQGGFPNPQTAYNYQNPYAQQNLQPMRSDSFNMNQLSGTLPNYQDLSGPRYSSTSPMQNFHPQNLPKYASSPTSSHGHNIAYANAFNAQFPGQYLPSHAPVTQSMQAGTSVNAMYYNPTGYPGHAHHAPQNYYVQQSQYMTQGPMFSVMPGNQQYPARGDFTGNVQHQQRAKEQFVHPGYNQQGRSGSRASNTSSVVRGPPRKPRQSGHAIWIGNLPPQADLMSLVNHVCKETTGLESLFLISKSNCAFANFKDEAACTEAQAKIHDSRFQTVRLVSRLRRNSTGTPAATGLPAEPAVSSSIPSVVEDDSSSSSAPESEAVEKQTDGASKPSTDVDGASAAKDKFFIVKSLTVEDLELSVRNGIWATQLHNEESLKKAYETAENVYLVFSANKSGEYFGYARMTSTINEDPAAAIEFAPKAQPVEDPTGELPKAIPTTANEFTPKGRIIDDSARGTIFWEVERDESEEEEDDESTKSEQDGTPTAKAWGKPFKIEWISTTRLPFYKTRGLRNPWNSNREVKIARDGTELETTVGKRLLGLFHRVPSPIGPISQMSTMQMIGGYAPHVQRYQQ